MTAQYTPEKDVKVGDLVNRVLSDSVFHIWSYFGRCISNNGKTLQFEVLIPTREIQERYGRPKHNGEWTPWGNWTVEIPYAGNEEHFRVHKDIVKRCISKKGYNVEVVTADSAIHRRDGRDPNWH